MRPLPGKSTASRDLGRVVALAACCLVAALTPFYAGFPAGAVGLVPVGLAIWLVTRSAWSPRTRVTTSLAVVAVTIAIFVGLLAVALALRYYN